MGRVADGGGPTAAASDETRSGARLRLLFLVVIAGFTIGVTVAAMRTEPFGMVVDEGSERLMDFASHREFACATWRGDSIRGTKTSIYTLDAHLRATEGWTHRPGHIALPFGYSPTMLWVLGPTCLVGPRAGFLLWSLAGIVAIGVVASRTHLPWTAMLPLATPLAIYAVALGQTAILSTAGLLWVMMRDRDAVRDRDRSSAIVLWLLTAKPPVAITAAVALLARRRWRPVVFAIVLTVASTLVLLPWLGPGWVHDYTALLGRYDRVRLSPAFAWSIVPETMSNLRAALSVDLGLRDDTAVELTDALWVAALALIAAVAWRRRSADWAAVWSFAILAYLLLCGHVSATENLGLCCILALVGVPRSRVATAAVAIVALGLCLGPGIVPPYAGRPSLLFFAMLGVAGLFLRDPRMGEVEALG